MKYDIKVNAGDMRLLRRKMRNLRGLDRHGIPQALKIAGATYEVEAKTKAPVDTGNLLKNIGYDLEPSGKDVELFSDAPYSGYVEFGTVHQKAQPFFRPAFVRAATVFGRELSLRIKKAIS